MKGNENNIRNTVSNILQQIPDNNQLIWININEGLQYKGLKEDVLNIETLCKTTYHSGSIASALGTLAHIDDDDYTSHELYILTDSQSSSILTLQEYSEELKSMNIYLFIAPKLEDNLSIVQLNFIKRNIITK